MNLWLDCINFGTDGGGHEVLGVLGGGVLLGSGDFLGAMVFPSF